MILNVMKGGAEGLHCGGAAMQALCLLYPKHKTVILSEAKNLLSFIGQ